MIWGTFSTDMKKITTGFNLQIKTRHPGVGGRAQILGPKFAGKLLYTTVCPDGLLYKILRPVYKILNYCILDDKCNEKYLTD